MNKIILLGDGGHASVIKEILSENNFKVFAICSDKTNPKQNNNIILEDDIFLKFKSDEIKLVNGIGFMPKSKTREKVYKKFIAKTYSFLKVISNNSMVSKDATVCDGAQLLPGSVINANAYIGVNSIINSGSIIEHDVQIGNHTHVCPGSVICGGSKIGNNVFIGAGTCIIQNIEIGDGAIIPAGSVIKKNI